MRPFAFALCCGAALLALRPARAWDDYTHMAVAKAAGMGREYVAVAPDVTKTKFHGEYANHFYDADRDEVIDRALVLKQAPLYDRDTTGKGCLLGAIIASFRNYQKALADGKGYAYYYLGFTAHYIGDLGMPLHLMAYDDFNKAHHRLNDELLEGEVLAHIDRIRAGMKPVTVRSEEELADEVANLARESRALGYKLRDENRDLTPDEAYRQLSLSASLLKAAMDLAARQP